MVDYPSDLDKRTSPDRQEPLIAENRSTLDNLPPEIRNKIMQQAMRVASHDPETKAEALLTANALRQTSPKYQQTLVSNPKTLGEEFQKLARDTVKVRLNLARDEVGGPGDERTADNVIGKRGPFSQLEGGYVRKVGALRDIVDHGMSVVDAFARHVVTKPEHQNQIMSGERARLREVTQNAKSKLDERSRQEGRGSR